MIDEIKTVKLSSKRQISIPSSFDYLEAGDKAVMEISKDKIIIRPLNKYKQLDEVSKSNLNILREDWDSEEDSYAYAHLQKYKE